jgi:hypothetical protein
MDAELKEYLEGRFSAFEGRFNAFDKRLDGLATAVAAEVGDLHKQIEDLGNRLTARFDSMDARLKLQAGLIQSGARAMAKFSEWSESSEERWVSLLGRVEAIERRLDNPK